MSRPPSLDLRVRVAAILAAGATVREAARRFGISVASAVRIGQPARSGQGLAARRIGGDRQPILLNASEAIIRRLVSKADRTGRALAADLKADGTAVSHDTVRRFLRRQGLTFKKVLCWRAGRSGRTWCACGRAGGRIKAGLIQPGSSLSTRPGSRPT